LLYLPKGFGGARSTTMSADRALLDTNILIYALDPTCTFYPA